ncbi:hypothetical protein GQ53DRAFT_464974 [Thozetella sp. PMI_491]|nr:hypothetical protein GQ53DRAFT_464974 [Thozetella sp. PMI_491]
MADLSTAESNDISRSLSSSPKVASPRTLARRACDACRVRRRRCCFGDSQAQCRGCAHLGIPCSFVVPTRVRGPKRRKLGVPSISAENGNRERDDQLYQEPGGRSLHDKSQLPSHLRSPVPVLEGSSPTIRVLSPSRDVPPASELSPLPVQAPTDVVTASSSGFRFPTDELCSRELLHAMVTDYLYLIYPLIPILHRPSFHADLAASRDLDDPEFLSLLIGIAALTVGLLPSRFHSYRAMSPEFAARFETRTAMINASYDMLIRLRDPSYFDHISLRKWAVCYLFYISFLQTGQVNRSRMLEAETKQLARLLELHRVSEQSDLNCIETQLRKKAFWLMFYSYAHDNLQRSERLLYLDQQLLRDINFDSIIPIDVDDEHIVDQRVATPVPPLSYQSPQGEQDETPRPTITLAGGFILHTRVFFLSMRETMSQAACTCGHSRTLAERLAALRDLVHELRYMLDDVPGPLRQWTSSSIGCDADGESAAERLRVANEAGQGSGVLHGQVETMRVNLHMTHLWLQSMLLDQVDVLLQKSTGRDAASCLRESWPEREDICRQMLHLLHSIPYVYLEPNGLVLTYKVRDVAVALLNCPFETHEAPARRAVHWVDMDREVT